MRNFNATAHALYTPQEQYIHPPSPVVTLVPHPGATQARVKPAAEVMGHAMAFGGQSSSLNVSPVHIEGGRGGQGAGQWNRTSSDDNYTAAANSIAQVRAARPPARSFVSGRDGMRGPDRQ